VHRVVTDIRDHRGQRILEPGPWLPFEEDAEHWAEILRNLGYKVYVQRMSGQIAEGKPGNNELADALSSMA